MDSNNSPWVFGSKELIETMHRQINADLDAIRRLDSTLQSAVRQLDMSGQPMWRVTRMGARHSTAHSAHDLYPFFEKDLATS